MKPSKISLSVYMYITCHTEISVSLLYLHQFCCALCLTGHSDWVRDVQFVRENGGDTLLASCSQDTSIRLWRITQQQQEQQQGEEGELKLKANVFTVECGMTFAVTLESILMGRFEFEVDQSFYA